MINKSIFLMFCAILLNSSNLPQDREIIYFYSTTCGECLKTASILDEIEEKYENISIQKYNIGEKKGAGLFKIYCNEYEIQEDSRYVPIVFISNEALIGYEKIELIEDEIDDLMQYNTPQYTYNELIFSKDNSNSEVKSLGVFIAGLINGLNPCSFAMFLFLLSLLSLKKDKLLKISLAFLSGKFITFLLLGTVLYQFLSYINISHITIIVKIVMIIFIISLIILNISDYFSSKRDDLGNIKLQLPQNLRKFNHNLMKRLTKFMDSKYLIFLVILISIGVSLTEFMCTGQIYLVTLVTLLHYSNSFNISVLINLIIYNIALILPLLFITIILYKGQDVFFISEKVQKNTYLIKLINAIFLLIILIVTILL